MKTFDQFINEAQPMPAQNMAQQPQQPQQPQPQQAQQPQQAPVQQQNRPGVPTQDRSLEAFPQLLDQIMQFAKGIRNPTVKQSLYQIINPFNQQMRQALQQYQQQGTGFNQNWQQ